MATPRRPSAPISAATSSAALAEWKWWTATSHPAPPNASAMARPSRTAPPVTKALWPNSFIAFVRRRAG